VIGERHRWHAVRGHLHELDGATEMARLQHLDVPRRLRR
jgi:hypothetical protein